jgi:hypothetical protein
MGTGTKDTTSNTTEGSSTEGLPGVELGLTTGIDLG